MTGKLSTAINDLKGMNGEEKSLFALLIFYSALFAGFFFLPTDAHRDVLYLSLPFSAYLSYKNRGFLKRFLKEHRFGIFSTAAFLLYIFASLFWSNTTEDGREFDKAKILLFLPLSMLGLFLLIKKTPQAYAWMIYSFVFSAFASALLLLPPHVIHIMSSHYLPRLEGFGRAENSVMAGYLYALALLAVVYAKPFARIMWQYRLVIALVIFVIMLLSLSRGPLLALSVAVGGMMVVKKQYKRIAYCSALGLLTIAVILATGTRKEIPIANRGDTGRPQVWAQSIDLIGEKPAFGHGIGSKFIYDYYVDGQRLEQASHPHSMYLSTMVQGGFAGLFLFIAVMGFVGYGALRIFRETGDGWSLAVFMSFATLGLYDFGGVYVNLGVVWVAFWYQYALIMAREKPDPVV